MDGAQAAGDVCKKRRSRELPSSRVPRQLYLPEPVASLRNVTETLAPGSHPNQR